MHTLDKKLLRDFKRLWLQALAISLVLACGVAILLTAFGMQRALNETRIAYYERNRFADIFATARRVPNTLLLEIGAIEGVQSVSSRISGFSVLDLPGRVETAVGHMLSLPEVGQPTLNIPLLRDGTWPENTGEVIVNEPFAEENGFEPGDYFFANMNGQKRKLTITGTVLSPEFIFTIGPGALMPDNATFGIVWMTQDEIAAAYDMTGAFDDLSLKLSRDANENEVIERLDELLERYGGQGAFNRELQISNAFIDAETEQLKGMAMILPPIFFGISAFLVSMVMGRIVALERSEIGLLKAIGYTDLEVCFHYLMLAGLVAFLGIGLGWAAGTWLSRGLATEYAAFFNFPFLIFRVSYGVYALAAFAALLTTTLGAARSALAAARLSPAVAMQPPAPPRFKRTILDDAMTWLRLSQPTIMILRSFIRWPLRSALTTLGLSLAVAAVVAATFLNDALDEIVDLAFYQTNRQEAMLLFADDLPQSVVEDTRRLPGVLQAEPQQYASAILRNGHLSKRIAIEARPENPDLSRVVSASGQVLNAPQGGIMLSDRLAKQLAVESGGTIEVEFTTGPRETHELFVTEVVTQHFGLGAYMNHRYLNTLFRQAPQISVVNIALDETRLDDMHAAIKDIPKLSGIVMLTDTRRSFQETVRENVMMMNTVYITIAVLITVGVAYNGARIQLSERARELASLRILGFSRREVSFVLIGETMSLALAAQPVGWLLGAGIAKLMTDSFESDLYSVPLVLKPAAFSIASLVVLTAAFVSVLVVRRRLDRLNLVTVMKTRE